jgi:hypothetical protein
MRKELLVISVACVKISRLLSTAPIRLDHFCGEEQRLHTFHLLVWRYKPTTDLHTSD